jgi:hypothetical protein
MTEEAIKNEFIDDEGDFKMAVLISMIDVVLGIKEENGMAD